ncbi:MAG: hypothetical protein ACFFCV_01355 [Promethearchaeota archaeon]
MPYINSKLIDIAKKLSFYIILGIIILVFIFNQLIAIILACIFFLIYLISYSINSSSKGRLLGLIDSYLIISDNEIANKLQRSLEDVRKILYRLSKSQKNKKWLVVFLNNRYIFLNEKGVEHFLQFYEQGLNEKKILESLQNVMKINSRAEVRAIQNTLSDLNRLTYSKLEPKK